MGKCFSGQPVSVRRFGIRAVGRAGGLSQQACGYATSRPVSNDTSCS